MNVNKELVSTCGACAWATPEGKSQTKVWCWLKAIQKFSGSISCPEVMRENEDFAAWLEEREQEARYDRAF